MSKDIRTLSKKIDDMENRSRINNVIIYGLEERLNENSTNLEQAVVKGVFKDKLGVETRSVERVHRIGKKRPNSTRPVIIRFYNFTEKMTILRNCKKLKNSSISISEDFSASVREVRSKLWQSSKAERNAGDKVTLLYDKLKVNDQLYLWNDEQKCRLPLNSVRHGGAGKSKDHNA